MKHLSVLGFFLMFTPFLYAQNVNVYPNLGHTGDITAFAYNPVKNILASVSINESFIKIWDAENAREIKTISTGSSLYYSLLWNKDYSVLICGTWAGELFLVDFQNGTEIRRWKAHMGSINSLSLSPDGSEILSVSIDSTVKKWDALTGREVAVFQGFSCSINQAVYSSDGRSFVLACSDGTVRIFDNINGRERLSIPVHTGPVLSVDCNTDASMVVSGGFDGLVKILHNDVIRQTINAHNGPVTSLSFSPDYTCVASCSTDRTVKEWDILNGTILNEFTGHESTITGVQYKNTGRILSSSLDNSIKEWDTLSKDEVNVFKGYSGYVRTLILSRDGRLVISGHEDSVVRIWDSRTGTLLDTLEGHRKHITSVDINSDGMKIASGSEDGTVRIWDIENKTAVVLEGHKVHVTVVSFSPDGTKLASGSMDNTVKIWDVGTGRIITEFIVENQRIYDVAWRPGGKQLYVSSSDNLYLLDLEDPSGKIKIENYYFSFSPDGCRLAGRNIFGIFILNVESDSIIYLRDEKARVDVLYYSPDGKYIASLSNDFMFGNIDNSINIWDAESGTLIANLEGHDSPVSALAFSTDSKRIVSSSGDGTIRIWDLDINETTGEITGSETLKMIGFTNGEWISITPEGYYNASPNGANYLNIRIGDRVYGINQYRDVFRRPDIVIASLAGRTAAQPGTVGSIQDAANIAPPVIEIISDETSENKDVVRLLINVSDERQNITKIEFYVNDSLIGRDVLHDIDGRNYTMESTALMVTGNTRNLTFMAPIPLTEEFNRIRIIAYNGSSFGEKILEVAGKPQEGPPNLWILAVGINHYPQDRQRIFGSLAKAVQDAHSFVESFKAQEGKLYRTVNSLIISDDSGILPTKENIMNNLNYLQNRGSNDIVILFIASHGLNDENENFYIIPRDFYTNHDNSIPFEDAAISSDSLKDILWESRGRKMVFLDTCHSGNFEGPNMSVSYSQVTGNLANGRIIIMTASKGSESAEERWNLRNGVFTHSFLEGMAGNADVYGEKRIYLLNLYGYIRRNVTQLTNNRQNPDIILPEGHRGDLIMAVLD